MDYKIEITPTGYESLKKVTPRKLARQISKVIDELKRTPERGKLLEEPLANHYSIRAGSNRYRIIYKINKDSRTVLILLVGKRKPGSKDDIYKLAEKLMETIL